MRGPDGKDLPNPGVYLEVVPGRRLVSTDAYVSAWVPSAKPFFTAIVTFEPEGTQTRYTAIARHWTEEARQQHEAMGQVQRIEQRQQQRHRQACNQQENEFSTHHIGRLLLDVTVYHAADHIGMDFHPGIFQKHPENCSSVHSLSNLRSAAVSRSLSSFPMW